MMHILTLMKKLFCTMLICLGATVYGGDRNPDRYLNGIRPPAAPLVTVDPYFSLWSMSDELTADVTRHWTGWKQPLLGAVRIDGRTYRIVGTESFIPKGHDEFEEGKETREDVLVDEWYYRETAAPVFVTAARQIRCNVLPTNTIYTFRCGGAEIELSFTAPLLLDDVDLLARPVNYVSWKIRPTDGRRHKAEIYLEASPRFAIDINVEPMKACAGTEAGLSYVNVGTVAQPVLKKRGDDIRIDWGYFYMAADASEGNTSLVRGSEARKAFRDGTAIPAFSSSSAGNGITIDNFETEDLALSFYSDLGKIGKNGASGHLMLAYDDIQSIKYLGQPLRPYWNKDGSNSILKELGKASEDYAEVMRRCEDFDAALTAEALSAGGTEYADLCALAYRQAVSAHKLVQSQSGELFFFSKENFSNGCCGTVDVTYPSMPLFLLYNPEIAKALLNFIFDYSEGPKWHRNWAPHDVGRYPDAYGQHYGNWMPLEECGNMLLLTAAVVKISGDTEYARRHWPTLTRWALYAVGHGQHPENQLCTDDFAGKLAHNANLSAKAIEGIAAYAQMAEALGKEEEAEAFRSTALEMAAIWKNDAAEEDHYKLTFDTEGSWSQKYNLVWNDVLDLNVFDNDIASTEIQYYRKHQNVYGLPLDCRQEYTKTDWIMWTAAMADDIGTFREFICPVWRFYNETVDRVPLDDWVDTDAPTKRNMQARSVVGGFFMRMLSERQK